MGIRSLDLEDLEEDQQASTDEGVDEDYSEAERRLALADYYRQLTKGNLFDDDSEFGAIVGEEVREFARERMNVLIGLQPERSSVQVELPFTDEQVDALRQWADHMIERASKPAEPTIRKVEAPTKKPDVSVRQPTAPRRLEKKETRSTPPRRPKPAPGKAQDMRKSEPVPQVAPEKDKNLLERALREKAEREANYPNIPTGEVFDEDGRQYKFIETGQADEDGKPKRVKTDVTPQIKSPYTIPTPRREHMNLISAQHASDTLDTIGEVGQHAAAASLADR